MAIPERRRGSASPVAQTHAIIPDSPGTGKQGNRVLGVIPARLASSRLPRKVLRSIAGWPMLAWVYEAAARSPELDQVVVATDSEEIAALCREQGWPFRLTSPDLASGSDRVDAVAREIDAEIYVNIQGDEPLLQPGHISALLRPFHDPEVEVSTLRVACTPENIGNPNAVKVVSALNGQALYFSRAPIPFHRDGEGGGSSPRYWKHIGLYAYRSEALHRFTRLQPSELEVAERLEQLRFLENGIRLHVETTEIDTIGVDTEEDLQIVDAILRRTRPEARPSGNVPAL